MWCSMPSRSRERPNPLHQALLRREPGPAREKDRNAHLRREGTGGPHGGDHRRVRVGGRARQHAKAPRGQAFPDTAGPSRPSGPARSTPCCSESGQWCAGAPSSRADLVPRGGPALLPRPYGAAVKHVDVTLLGGLDSAIAAMRQDGELKRTLDRYGLWDTVQTAPAEPAAPKSPATKPVVDQTLIPEKTPPWKPNIPGWSPSSNAPSRSFASAGAAFAWRRSGPS